VKRAVRVALAIAALGGWGAESQDVRGPSAVESGGLVPMDVDLMFVGAHPDDDGDTLAALARYVLDEGFKATVVTLTGGEGGGNAIGREAGRALGLIRQEEERRALALAGVTLPHFLGLEDFYFTLSAEEAARRWGDGFVCDVVRLVRLRRPEVIVTMWPGPGTHGQHQMASRAATIAFVRASDPSFCPAQIAQEFLEPFAPLKLYYYPNARAGQGLVSIPTSDYSRTAAMRYADWKGIALLNYRTQGYDQFPRIPVKEPRPEVFRLARSRVPVLAPETHLLAGAGVPSGTSPVGVRLEAIPARFAVGVGEDVPVTVSFQNGTRAPFEEVKLSLEAPPGWTVEGGGAVFERVTPGSPVRSVFVVRATEAAPTGVNSRLRASYAGRHEGVEVSGDNPAWMRAVPRLEARFRPTYDIEGYRAFARETGTEWVIETLPARVPAKIGGATPVRIEVFNHGPETVRGELAFVLPEGVRAAGPMGYQVRGNGRADVEAALAVSERVLPEGRHSARVPIQVSAGVAPGGADPADLYALPLLRIPRVAAAPRIDGDLADMASFAHGSIGPKDLWRGKEPTGPEDLSCDFFLAYDAKNLYAGLRVRDDVVVCNIAPDDVRAQLRSDAVGITIDPFGASRDTSATLQIAAFPCTTAGFEARAFRDADARPGLIEETAPGTRVVSRKTAEGYDIEFAIPWTALPSPPKAGDEIGLNVVLYDGDEKDARPGANINESGLAWAAFELGGKQALPYLWPRVVLGR
jgi:LmbE family N-acetylglucosaminyl deacetylase